MKMSTYCSKIIETNCFILVALIYERRLTEDQLGMPWLIFGVALESG
jgi:hypothetical protein